LAPPRGAQELEHVGKALFHLAQLDFLCGLFELAGDNGHGGPAAEQIHSGLHLGWPNFRLGGDLENDAIHKQQGCRRGHPSEGSKGRFQT
jgi:hypothetical protein